jgi:phosphatidate cytidylyltransferase
MSNLTKRILSAIILIPLVLFLVFFSSFSVLHISISLVSAICGFEFSSIAFKNSFRFLRFFVSLCSGLFSFLIPLSSDNPVLLFSFFAFCSLSLPLFFMFSGAPIFNSLNSLAFSFFCIFYCGSLSSFLTLTSLFNPEDGRYLLFMLLLGTFLGDTGAFAFGRIFGKRKLAPNLSPGKTWAGAFGGFFLTLLSILLVKFFFISSITLLQTLLLSLLLSIFCQCGDLSESFFKRGFNVKDSGNLIPGHGGLLDRVDALLFGAPVVFFFSILR